MADAEGWLRAAPALDGGGGKYRGALGRAGRSLVPAIPWSRALTSLSASEGAAG